MKLYALSITTFALAASFASAQTITDVNSSADINAVDGSVTSWEVDGVDQAFYGAWLFRTSPSDVASSLSALTLSSSTFGTNTASLTYVSAGAFEIKLSFLISDDGSTSSGLAESISVKNLGTSGLRFELFKYDDFDLGETSDGDTLVRSSASSFTQTDGLTEARVDHSLARVPDRTEIGNYPDLINNLENTPGYNLNTLNGDGIGETVEGDTSYGSQWALSIGAGRSVAIGSTKTLEVVPEPASMAVLGLGLAALKRRRKNG